MLFTANEPKFIKVSTEGVIVSRKQSRTISQAVPRIAESDRTAAQRLWGSRDVIGHVTIR